MQTRIRVSQNDMIVNKCTLTKAQYLGIPPLGSAQHVYSHQHVQPRSRLLSKRLSLPTRSSPCGAAATCPFQMLQTLTILAY